MSDSLSVRLTDTALDPKVESDILGLGLFATALAEYIDNCPTPMTIGVQGDWGSGKTSLMNMMKTELKKTIVPIDINTWQYSQFSSRDLLGLALIDALLSEIRDVFKMDEPRSKKLSDLSRRLRDVARTVTVAGVRVGAILDNDESSSDGTTDRLHAGAIDPFQVPRLLRDFKRDFAEMVDNILSKGGSGTRRKKIVLCIDDLDRLEPQVSVEVLEAIKNFLDVPGCVFVLAVDFEIIRQGMKSKFGSAYKEREGRSFFDKIIQVPLRMPYESYRTTEFVKSLLESANFLNSARDLDWRYFSEMLRQTVGINPRAIKRVINYANLVEIIRKRSPRTQAEKTRAAKVNEQQKILFALICMQIAWPELFAYFSRHPTPTTISKLQDWDAIEELPEGRRLLSRVTDPDRVRDQVAGFFDLLYSQLDTRKVDGVIDEDEFQIVHQVMLYANLTAVESEDLKSGQQKFLDAIASRFEGKRDPAAELAVKSWEGSSWNDPSAVELRRRTPTVVTFSAIAQRKQIATLMSTNAYPFGLRSMLAHEVVEREWRDVFGEPAPSDTLIDLVKEQQGVIGIGDTMIDIYRIGRYDIEDSKVAKFLDRVLVASIQGSDSV
ncbi:MAG: hypothetical protein D6800_09665 [Candidatus Zixiibacteriota bacterium]|nr:MAG: hypothetical protein D6800_09665 [candidate division Zixibacteria bacterium]